MKTTKLQYQHPWRKGEWTDMREDELNWFKNVKGYPTREIEKQPTPPVSKEEGKTAEAGIPEPNDASLNTLSRIYGTVLKDNESLKEELSSQKAEVERLREALEKIVPKSKEPIQFVWRSIKEINDIALSALNPKSK